MHPSCNGGVFRAPGGIEWQRNSSRPRHTPDRRRHWPWVWAAYLVHADTYAHKASSVLSIICPKLSSSGSSQQEDKGRVSAGRTVTAVVVTKERSGGTCCLEHVSDRAISHPADQSHSSLSVVISSADECEVSVDKAATPRVSLCGSVSGPTEPATSSTPPGMSCRTIRRSTLPPRGAERAPYSARAA